MRDASGKSSGTPPHTVRALVLFLRGHPPFNQMDDQILGYLVENSKLVFFPADAVVLSPETGPAETFFVVKQGRVRGERPGTVPGEAMTVFEIGPGECFPRTALLAGRATRTVHRAATDLLCLSLPRGHFVRVFAESLPFRNFCLRGVSSLLDEVNRHIQAQAQSGLGAQYSLNATLGDLARRGPVTCAPNATLREALVAMHGANVGSIVVTEGEEARPVGIFTLHDLRRVLADGSGDLDAPVGGVMTGSPRCLSPRATAFEAALLMARHHFGHVPVVDRGQLVGVVSQRDVFSLQRVDLVHLARAIANAPDLDALVRVQNEVARMAEAIIAHGASAEQLNHVVTMLNDYTARQAIRLCVRELGDPGIPFVWLAFGSSGRKEQTLLTDQDNGILFTVEDPAQAEVARGRLLPLARAVNVALDRCGFALCKGNMMAGNPELCLSSREWGQWFHSYLDNANEQNLLHSCIFFDLRAQWGDPLKVEEMFAPVRQRIQGHSLFRHLLARVALNRRAPLGLFGFVRQTEDETADGVNLKIQGLGLFVDAARVFALAAGVQETNTVERIRALAARQVFADSDARAWEEAFNVIQLLRVRHHLARRREGAPLSNIVDPDLLNPLEQRILKEALRQAQRLQQQLAATYHR